MPGRWASNWLTLQEHPEYGLCPVGFVDDVGAERLPLPIYGGVDLLRLVLFERQTHRPCDHRFRVAREANMIQMLRGMRGSLRGHTRAAAVRAWSGHRRQGCRRGLGHAARAAAALAVPPAGSGRQAVFDVSLAGFALLVLSPLYGALAMALEVDQPGPWIPVRSGSANTAMSSRCPSSGP